MGTLKFVKQSHLLPDKWQFGMNDQMGDLVSN